jgi:outer membrane protein assembly factor BamB
MLEADSGRVLHRRAMAGLVRCRPAILDETLVVADSSGQVLALDLEGRVRWSRQLADSPSAGLIAGRSAVYVATYGQEALALRVSDGALLWDRGLPAPAGGSVALSDRLVLIGLVDGRICAFPRPAGD